MIRLRFGIGCEREHTLEEIGQVFELTRERIRQIEAMALRQSRAPERARMCGAAGGAITWGIGSGTKSAGRSSCSAASPRHQENHNSFLILS